MVAYRDQSAVPEETIARVDEWLAAGEVDAPPARGSAADPPATLASLERSDPGISERAIAIAQPDGDSFAIVAEPLGARSGDICAVFLNAGEVRHIGPNRNWVESGRRWAAAGVPTVRIDLEGIGEADGDRADPRIAEFYDEIYAPQLTAVLDEIERLGVGSRFVCIGLCSGAYWALQLADRDPRVIGGVMLNPGAIVWDPDLRSRRDARLLSSAVLSRESWRRLFYGDVDLRRKAVFLRNLARSMFRRVGRALRPRSQASAPKLDPTLVLERVHTKQKRIALGFCLNEPVLAELNADGITKTIDEWQNLELDYLEGEDHALGPIGAQRHAARIIDREMELNVGAAVTEAEPQRS